MIFNSKQLEELENIHDSTGAFEEEGDEEGGFDEVGEAAMDWRRGLIEEAAENVKRAKTRPVEPHLQYPINSMLFDRDARRFARVQRSVPGYLKIVYLSGGDREFGNLDVIGYLKDHGAHRRLSELSEQLGMADIDVATELERLGISPVEELEADAAAAAAEAAVPAEVLPPEALAFAKAKKPKATVDDEVDDAELVATPNEAATPKNGVKLGAKDATVNKTQPPMKAAPPTKANAAKPAGKDQKASTKDAKASAAKPAVKKASGKTNPIDDPNGYIKANYKEMSNRELARETGLSEHTIRRKLGEWGMRRAN